MAEKIFIHTLLGFTTSEQKLVKGIKCMCLPEKDVMIEPNEVKNALYFTEMYIQKVYMTKAGDHENWVSRSTVVSGEKEPFRDQWYLREDGSEPYDHFDLLENFHPNEGCTKCFEREIGCGWTQFPRCTQWYHEQCFYNSIWLLIFLVYVFLSDGHLYFWPSEFPAVSLEWWVCSHFLNNDFDSNLLRVLVYLYSPSLVIFFPSQNLKNSKL